MIGGCRLNGQRSECSKLFDQMHDNGYASDAITFTSLLLACSHCGLIEDGCKFFDLMVTKYKIQPTMEHWTCIIDMLGRGNDLEEAYDVIETGISHKYSDDVPLDSVDVWEALLSACRNNMSMELGESSNKRFDEATEIRKVFGDGKMMKKPGLSSLKSYID
uniref:Pentatricopeptide repeat-containing protein n=1 Tax=Tanacetum cinerariifolium TaxID=118510 RepID=A0A699HC50_TANCI|nr:hypothetical protein [Tanacetum cinerariifolium]GFA33896.1 hypothetical protein [Tanacetum cinerariifolium]